MLPTGAHPGELMWGCRDKLGAGSSFDGSFLGEAELTPEMFPTSLQGQQGGCSSPLWTSPQLGNNPTAGTQPPPLAAAGPGEQPFHRPARTPATRDESFTEPSAAAEGLQELMQRRERRSHPRESEGPLPAGRAPASGLRAPGSGGRCHPLAAGSGSHRSPSRCFYFGNAV